MKTDKMNGQVQSGQFLLSGRIYEPHEARNVLKNIDLSNVINTNKGVALYNIPCAFDIETSSFYRENDSSQLEKVAIMYEWTFGINGYVFIGRNYKQLIGLCTTLKTALKLNEKRRLVVYVHNLGFEFQFIRKHFEWEKIFAIDSRKPAYAITTGGIEFRCSYLLSGYSLEKIGENLVKYKVAKMVGDLDYSLLRHSETVLSNKELKYCENDVRVVMSYIQEKIESDGDISKIPLTKTGYVRRFCKKNCLYGEKKKNKEGKKTYWKYRNLMKSLSLTSDEYLQLKRAFMGGFTHANAFRSNVVQYNVSSYDFCSSYPYVMVAEKFPMSRGEIIEIKDKEHLDKMLNMFCCLFDVEFFGIIATKNNENYLSLSRCFKVNNYVQNNGRILKADYVGTTITEQDFAILSQYYKWEQMRIYNFRIYKKEYLPTAFVKSILSLYADKTTLKGVEGKEIEYLSGKEMLNASYGMSVTDIVRDEQIYSDDIWKIEKPDIDTQIMQYNEKKDRFLFYAWGVWVTAYARRNLFSAITELGNDYVYSDTDSVKVLNADRHKDYFSNYNMFVEKKLHLACDYHGIDYSMVKPKTNNGVEKLLGVWEYEGEYTRFKTLGAKRYMVESDNKISITVSGVNKKHAVPYLLDTYGNQVFDAFKDTLQIPASKTGKLTHTYIDERKTGYLVDYTGKRGSYDELSAVHLEPAEYSLSLSIAYLNYLHGIREISE